MQIAASLTLVLASVISQLEPDDHTRSIEVGKHAFLYWEFHTKQGRSIVLILDDKSPRPHRRYFRLQATKLSDDLSGITTAKKLLSDIEMSCSASDTPSSDGDTHGQSVRRPDVLFIVIEDMAAIPGSYGHPVVRTPNFDRLAQHGVLFERAYVQAPVCNPSRASVSTGLRPETTGVDHNDIDWRGRIPKGHLTLPEFFPAKVTRR